jgi:outer membrane protein insertion porin family
VVVNVDVEEQSTGEFSVSGGYSTTDGFLAEVSVGERNLLGRGQYAKASVQYGQYAKGFTVSFAEPYFLDRRLNFGVDVFARQTIPYSFQSFGTTTYGASTRFGIPLREDFGVQLRYSAYNQKITLNPVLNNCNDINPDFITSFPTPDKVNNPFVPPAGTTQFDCFQDGEASLAVKQAALRGSTWVSMPGYSLIYNTLNQPRYPTSGMFLEFKQDVAGLGGDVDFLKTTIDGRTYYEVFPDVVAIFRAQAGHVTGWGGQDVRMLDNFFGGPWLVRGFAPNGFGPRDITPGTTMDNLGGNVYWTTSAELQAPMPFVPPDAQLKIAMFSDTGSLWATKASTVPSLAASLSPAQQIANSRALRSSIGASLIWDSMFGPIRVDYAYPIAKQNYDVTQRFQFHAGAF